MSLKTEATIDDLFRMPKHTKAELVNGEIVLMSPSGGFHGWAAGKIYASLLNHEERTKLGHALPDNVGFIVDLAHRKSFSPDAAFYLGKLAPGFLEGAPVFAVEVRSEGDYGPAAESEMAEKRADYFAAGAKVVWDVDLNGPDVVRSYRSDDPEIPAILRRGETANAEPALPGWSIPVNALWPTFE